MFFSRFTMIFLFDISLSLTALIILSSFPFPLWSLIGHKMCWMNLSLQNCLNFSPVNTVPGTVFFLFEVLFAAIYFCKNSINLSGDGFGRNSASGHPQCLSTDTNKYFFLLIDILKRPGQTERTFIVWSACFRYFSKLFLRFRAFKFLPYFWHSVHFWALSTFSR